MKDVIALVVGIDRYKQHSWPELTGPSDGAIQMIDWLVAKGVPANQIYVFLARRSTGPAYENPHGVTVHPDAKYQSITVFCDESLKKIKAGTKLIFYWCGHGGVSSAQERVFYCEDYSQETDKFVFRFDQFLLDVRKSDYRRLDDQLFIADVCGVHVDVPAPPVVGRPALAHVRQQRVCLATPAGATTKIKDDVGWFTRHTLELLMKLNGWPDENFVDSLKRSMLNHGRTPHLFEFNDRTACYAETIGKLSEDILRSTVENLLLGCAIDDSDMTSHYNATVSRIGRGDLTQVTTLVERLGALCGLHRVGNQQLPDALVEFLLRLAKEFNLAPTIDPWLRDKADTQRVCSIQARLDKENSRKKLIIKVDHNDQGMPATCEFFLRYMDNRPVIPTKWLTETKNVDELKGSILNFIKEQVKNKTIDSSLSIHIIIDIPLFHIQFHQFEYDSGFTLGQSFRVTIHFRKRVDGSDRGLIDQCEKYDAKLREKHASEIRWMDFQPDGTLPDGLVVMNFAQSPGQTNGVKMLKRVLGLGVPYMCLPHELAFGKDNEEPLSQRLPAPGGDWLRTPDNFLQARLSCDHSVVNHASLLWDEPSFRPFAPTRGV